MPKIGFSKGTAYSHLTLRKYLTKAIMDKIEDRDVISDTYGKNLLEMEMEIKKLNFSATPNTISQL